MSYDVSPGRRAIHEAGHASIAFEVGIGVQYVTIERHNAGYCEYEPGLDLKLEYDFRTWGVPYIMAQLGGMKAETRFAGGPGHAFSWDEDKRLVAKGIECLFSWGVAQSPTRQEELFRLGSNVQDLIADDRVWAGIHAIAAALLELGTISGEVAKDIYQRATG